MVTAITFRMNGVGNAFLKELGCNSCPQCSEDKKRANTSGSLILRNGRKIESHFLFDCGNKVVDSLMDYNINQVDYIFNTHNHLDHIAGFDRLLNSLKRSSKSNYKPIPFYSTDGTWNSGINKLYDWLTKSNKYIEFKSLNKQVENTQSIKFLKGNIKITPIPVYHGKFANEPVIFVIEFGEDEAYKKLIICWDLLHLVKNYKNKNKYDNPNENNKEFAINPEGLKMNESILFEADELFLAGNTITPKSTDHISIISGFELIKLIQPKRTWIVHYSGHEDDFGSLSDDNLQHWIDINKINYGLKNRWISVAKHGMEITYSL